MAAVLRKISSSMENLVKRASRVFTGDEACPQYRVLMLGEDKAGKFALWMAMMRNVYTHEPFRRPDMIEIGIPEKDDTDADIQLIVTFINSYTTNDRIPALKASTAQAADCFIICFSLNDKSTFDRLDKHVDYVIKHAREGVRSIALVGCKEDVKPHEVTREKIADFMVKIAQKGVRSQCFLTSAYKNVGISQLKAYLVGEIQATKIDEDDRSTSSTSSKKAARKQKS